MIIIITGATHTGKTQLAQKYLEEYHIPYFSIDHLKMGLIRSHNINISVEDDEKLTKYLWPIIREMIKTAIENKQNMIVEGCYVPFDWEKDFNEYYLNDIYFICLCMSDAYIEKHFDLIESTRSIIENRQDDGYCTMELLKRQNRFYQQGCEEYKLSYCLIEDNYYQSIQDYVNEIMNR